MDCDLQDQSEEIIKLYNKTKEGALAVFHYLSLHQSPYYAKKHDGRVLNNCDNYSDRLLRLPLFFELKELEQQNIIRTVIKLIQE